MTINYWRGAYREVQSKLMQFQPRCKNERRFCNDRLNSLIFCTSDKKKKKNEACFYKRKVIILPLVNLTSHSRSVENNRKQTITKELRCRWKKVTRVRVVLTYFYQDATVPHLWLRKIYIYEGRNKQMKICNLYL